jgi:hypothetical protein
MADDGDDLEQRIRERAYQIWEQEGRPEGRHDEIWQKARSELDPDPSREDKPSD